MEILRASQVLIGNDISGAPVLDRHGRLIGILTERDCLRVVLQAAYHGEPGGQVHEYMSWQPVSVRPDDTILDLAQRFIKEKYRRYPVLDGGRLVGVISRRDVMRAMGEHYPA
jgi:CBS domain-containing protein